MAMPEFDPSGWIAAYGYWAVLVLVGLESMGLPLPGETALIAAAVYAGTRRELNVAGVIAVASIGAVIGDNIGYEIGRRLGFPLLVRYGSRIGLDERRLKLGQYLFRRHGGSIVFFGRFVAFLRTFTALLAGANRMPLLILQCRWSNYLGISVWHGGLCAGRLGASNLRTAWHWAVDLRPDRCPGRRHISPAS
jgi:membrane protein DedA with SNARE-associated domain